MEAQAGEKAQAAERLANIYAGGYQRALDGVFVNPKAGSQGWDLYVRFAQNMGKFAAFKGWRLAEALGRIRGDRDYQTKAQTLADRFAAYQVTEFNTAAARARTARQMGQFAKDADILPNIEWLPTASISPRDEHQRLTGLVLPQDHPFWRANQPGNLYGCKCDWTATDKPATQERPWVAP